jgi:hypothetical protein
MNTKAREWFTSTATIAGAVAAAVAGAVALAENVEKFVHAKAVLYVFVVADFLFWELLLLSVVILCRGFLLGQFRALSAGYRLIRSRKAAEPRLAWYSALATVMLAAAMCVSLYYGIRYLAAKAQFRKRYSSIMAARAVDAFRSGQSHRARFYLRVGSEVLAVPEFAAALKAFDERMAEAEKLRDVLAKLPAVSPHRGELIAVIERLDYRHDDAVAAVVAEKARLQRLRKIYEAGAAAVRQGDFAAARSHFLEVFQFYPSFGDVHRVIAELNRMKQSRGGVSASLTPYVDGFRRGDHSILNALIHPSSSIIAEAAAPPPKNDDESQENE